MKNFLCALLLCFAASVQAFDVNRASAFELQTIRGIGEKMAQTIVQERSAHGAFRNWNDFKARIKGVGNQTLKRMQSSGLTLLVKP
ncbi:MAG: ComEA family DNA-binding protein [Formosimonas sp.]